MIKYRGKFRVYMPEDSTGKTTLNEDDTYLKANHNTEIYRYDSSTLAVMFTSNGYANNRLKDFKDKGISLQLLQCGDEERVYLFKESDFNIVVEILKPKIQGANKSPKKINRKELTKEQQETLNKRMELMRSKIKSKNKLL